MSDHIQKVLKPNFAAAWEEVGDTFEKEETFALSSTKTLEGENNFSATILPDSSVKTKRNVCFSFFFEYFLPIYLKGQIPVFTI